MSIFCIYEARGVQLIIKTFVLLSAISMLGSTVTYDFEAYVNQLSLSQQYSTVTIGKEVDLRDEVIEKLKGQPAHIELTSVDSKISTVEEAIVFFESVIDSGSYDTSGINNFNTTVKENADNSTNIYIKLDYMNMKSEEDFVSEEVERILDTIVNDDMTTFEEILAVHDYLVDNSTYSSDTVSSQYTAYTLLKEGKGVCNAYAMAFSKFMDELHIDNYYVKGYAIGEGETGDWGLHAWNKVEIDNVWYNIDSTWEYPSATHGLYNAYNYFLNSDDKFYKDHYPRGGDDLPESKDDRYDYMYDQDQ